MSSSPSLKMLLALVGVLFSFGMNSHPALATDTAAFDEPNTQAMVRELRAKNLLLPVDTDPEQWKNSFFASRGDRMHEAVDMMVPRNTPIRAVEDGTIARVSWNAKGGNTIYQKDATGRFTYYYAHLEKYEEGLKAGDLVSRGQVIGYVGTTGNAPPNAPHLHFSITVAESPKYLSQGQSINPYEVFSSGAFTTAANSVPFAPEQNLHAGYHAAGGILSPPKRSPYRPAGLSNAFTPPTGALTPPSNSFVPHSASASAPSGKLSPRLKNTLLKIIQSSVRRFAYN